MLPDAVSRVGEPRLGILVEVVTRELVGETTTELCRVPPGIGPRIEESEHVRRKTKPFMKVGVPAKVEDRCPTDGAET